MLRRNEILFLIVLLIPTASATTISIEHSPNAFDVVCVPSEPLNAYEFSLHYDPSIIEVDYSELGNFFYPNATFSFLHAVPGEIIVYSLLLGNSTPINTTGTFLHVTYHPIGFGSTDLSFSDYGVTNESMYVPAEWIDSRLTFDHIVSNANVSIEGYFEFSNEANYVCKWFGYFYFFNMARVQTPEYGAFSFSNNASFVPLDDGYFLFECPPQSPVNDIGSALVNNINLIIFIVLVTVVVIALTWLGLRWQRRRQML
jgi:hypothetical protein